MFQDNYCNGERRNLRDEIWMRKEDPLLLLNMLLLTETVTYFDVRHREDVVDY